MNKKVLYILLIIALTTLQCLFACAAPSPAPGGQVINLKYSSAFQAAEDFTKFGYYFCDMVEQKSGGRVKFERFPGAVLGTMPEHIELLRSGLIHVTNLPTFHFPDDLPLHTYPPFYLDSPEGGLEYHYKTEFENPETAAILAKELAENNIKQLNFHYMGKNGIIAKEPFKTLADLKNKKIGVFAQKSILSEFGIVPVSLQIPDFYESLSRGVIDGISLAVSPMVALKWYEVAKCFMSTGDLGYGGQLLINLDTWNSLPADIQKVFTEAAKSSREYSIKYVSEADNNSLKIFKDAGLEVGKVPDEDCQKLFKLNYDQFSAEMRALCERRGKSAEAEVILKYTDSLIPK